MAKFSYIDLFSGIGGFRVALDSLGGQSRGFAEIDQSALATMSVQTLKTDDKNKVTNQNSKFADFDVFFNDLQKHDLINLDKADNPQTAYKHWYSIYKNQKLRLKLQFLAKFFKRVRADEILSNSSNPQFLKYIFGRIFSRDLLSGIRLSSLQNLDEFISQAYDWLGKDYSNGADVMDSIEDHISLEDLLDYYEAYTIDHYAKLQAN
ncbi:MAG: DNA cytosine methyltransferase [Candidatus Saccharibacteria bacterium]|nr:DNA cytosine methyltransferase [Candidatus Saccharibacteria bacterium]